MMRADEKQKRLLLYFYVRDVEKKVINWETCKTCVIRNPDSKELPEPLVTPLVFIYENKLYAFGIPASFSSKIAAALFDPAIGSWKELPSAPRTSSSTNRYRPRGRSIYENRIYPAFILEREKTVVLKLRSRVYFFNLVECTWTTKDDTDCYLGIDYYRNRGEHAVVIGDILYTCCHWDIGYDLMYLRAYNLKDSIWLEDDHLIMPPFRAQFVLLSQIGENTICLVCSSLDTTEGRPTTRLYWIKADLIKDFYKDTGARFVMARNVDRSPNTLQYQGELFSCLPLCSPVNEIAKKISIRYAGNKRQRELSAWDLDFIS